MTFLRLGIFFAYLLTASHAYSHEKSMTIEGYPPDLPVEIAGNAWFLFLDGRIDADTPQLFRRYLEQNNVPSRSHVIINSPGGNLFAGMELGRLFRKHSLSIDVGRKSLTSKKRFDTEIGGCFSSCAIAYLGGEFRYLKAGSRYGVHRFAFTKQSSADADIAQVASAEITTYIRSMDADVELFKLSSAAAPSDMNEPDRATLERLNVINNGFSRPVWTIESAQGKLYLKGERSTTLSGINKFMILCDDGGPLLYTIFDPLGRDKEVMAMPVHSLMLDGRVYPVEALSKEMKNGWFNSIYRLTNREVGALRSANHVGVAVRFTHEAGVFLGFDHMPISGGRDKLLGILNNCR
jgi:hypothetical protein